MKIYGADLQGILLVQRVATLPTWTSDYVGAVIYAIDTNLFWFGGSSAWISSGSSSGVSYVDLKSSAFSLDATNVGTDYGSAFSMIPTINFAPFVYGSIWGNFNFRDSGFSITKNMIVDLRYVFNGSVGSTLSCKINVNIWVVNDTNVPSSGSPSATQTTGLSVAIGSTGQALYTDSFMTISNALLGAGTDSIIVKITRNGSDGDDTYTGTFQLTNLIVRQ